MRSVLVDVSTAAAATMWVAEGQTETKADCDCGGAVIQEGTQVRAGQCIQPASCFTSRAGEDYLSKFTLVIKFDVSVAHPCHHITRYVCR
jgi:hypothetical protein